jgi:hypothetical protein
LYSGNILPSAQGKHTKFRSIIFEDGAQHLIKEALRNNIPELQRTPEKFISVCETDIFPNIPNAPLSIAGKTAHGQHSNFSYVSCKQNQEIASNDEREDIG